MPFDESTVVSINPEKWNGNQVWISWVPTASGLLWQVYINAALAYEGSATGAWMAAPSGSANRVNIGSILASEAGTDFSASLPPAPARRAKLTWQGGTGLASDIEGFKIYWGASPGSAVSYSTAIADIKAFPGGSPVASGNYQWTSDPLTSGVYHFGIRPYDSAGNEGTTQETTVTIAVPPLPPAAYPTGERLRYTFHPNGGSPTVTLNWNASPG